MCDRHSEKLERQRSRRAISDVKSHLESAIGHTTLAGEGSGKVRERVRDGLIRPVYGNDLRSKPNKG